MSVTEYHVLNLGAGVQSTTLYLMACLKDPYVPISLAVFADTQEEPEAVYRHLEWLESLGGPKIHRVTTGKLGDDLLSGRNSTGQRFASIPAFTLRPDGTEGRTRRQCSREYKTEPVERFIRRELLGLKPKQRIPKSVRVYRYFGFSFDEQGRAERMKDQVPHCRFPLIERMMRRADCLRWMDRLWKIPHEVPRSACVFCPYHSNAEWRRIRDTPADWQRAVEIDESLRINGNIVNRGLDWPLFVHRSCRPLAEARIDTEQGSLFDEECEGACGI